MHKKAKKFCIKAVIATLVEILTHWCRKHVTDQQLAECIYHIMIVMMAKKRGWANA